MLSDSPANANPDRRGGLKRQLGLSAVVAVVMGDMMGSGIFFTPGELAPIAESNWQVYFIWALAGFIVLCGALTLSELASFLPRAGATYHILGEAFGPFWAFLKVWMEIFISAPGSIAGVAVAFSGFAERIATGSESTSTPFWGIGAIWFFAGINLLGVRWGGRTQVALTTVKVLGLLCLVLGSFFLAEPAARTLDASDDASMDWLAFVRFVGLGVAAVLFTYDGWTDISHTAGEVTNPRRNLPFGLGFGVLGIVMLYLIVNVAFLRVMPLHVMKEEGATVATTLAIASFGEIGGSLVNVLIVISIFGALGGLVMTAPRLVFAPSARYAEMTRGRTGSGFFRALSYVSPRTSVPASAIVFSATLATTAILFFGTFGRLVTFIFVPLQLTNILTVVAVLRLRQRTLQDPEAFLTPGYPIVPLVFAFVMSLFIVSAIVYSPLDTFIGIGILALGGPVYMWIRRGA
jgi:APA family basic amino acid/polyamine antiporter